MVKKIVALGLTSTVVLASGFRIPEQSVNSVALSGAYIANTKGADTAYFNPANMSFMSDKQQTQLDATWIHLSEIDYKSKDGATNISSEKEDFYIPTLFYVSPAVKNFRFGLSLTAPFGLSKRWNDEPAKTSAQEFTLEVLELNPVASFKVSEKFSVAGGIRILRSEGVVKSDGDTTVSSLGGAVVNIKRDMQGDSIDYGYNLALTYKPNAKWTLASTYRSEVDLDIEGDATLSSTPANSAFDSALKHTDYRSASVGVGTPAVWTLAAAYTLENKKTTIEFVFDRTFWSNYDKLDFKYNQALSNGVLTAAFDDNKQKDWNDVNAYRLGVTHVLNPKWTLRGSYVYDETPVPNGTLGYELPDSDAHIFGLGGMYQYNKDLSLGVAYLLDIKESRDVNNDSIQGEFSGATAHLFTLSANYQF